ncbi:MAG: nucleoside deaminase [Oscillospiraceae bacterium]|nr:nucleoside deaminase [Oscillospiraceae bacterium]MDD7353927.1 nucleoside deaminase [Oscillospiraceae bacterium]MDY3938082.1 nucleoside deaminase [Oscillospiraceae bacterium]
MTDRELMNEALRLAKEAYSDGEVPVGAVIALNGEIVSTGRNRREKLKNALSHAEIEAINSACEKLGRWRLDDCVLYVTLEPCPMCAGACINARLKRVVFGAYDYKAGSFDSAVDLNRYGFNHKPEITAGFMENECKSILTSFFDSIR